MVEATPFKPKIDFHANRAGVPYATLDNFKKLIRANLIKIRYNEITKDTEIEIPGATYLPDNRFNCGVAFLTSLCVENKMSPNSLLKYIQETGDANKINPVKDWIEGNPWDGISRIQSFMETIVSRDEILKESLINRWMISAIAALYQPKGISASGMLVFYGRQNLGKTNWFKNLLPSSMRDYLKDGMLVDATKRDSFMPCLENWLVELGELEATFKRADLAALKAFITSDRDITRLSYAAGNSRFPRRTVFFGSVDKKSYLTDPAGNRRFWTVECEEINHTHGLDMQQIWAEFKVLYDEGENWHLDKDEYLKLMESNKDYEMIDPLEEKIRKKYNWDMPLEDWKTATEILEGLDARVINQSEATRCAMIIRRLNGGRSKRTKGRNFLAIPGTSL